ncbi:hypothetical protein [Bradyrhizobium ottawaense]|uniref:Uncharacterized protein n=1 Tax=Bradyrhizobium ottawaense TaxID=931866 RepID=A0ABY0QHB1_9BRAD|nr:hypothetical protein [Bradyrhizobium ottawaense]SDK43142.1 hypothetical protein SAMN05444163_8095 [Bradyrhizobium ottawaense]
MARRTKQSKVDAARIQRAVTGILIPMTSITRVYAHAEKLIAEGADDDHLANGIRVFLGGL